MKITQQFLIIIIFAFLGELLHWLLPFPIPASIYGIILLFSALKLKIVRVSQIKETSSFLIEIMPIIFLPPAVGVLKSWGIIADKWLLYVGISILTTFFVIAIAGTTTQFIIKHSKKEKK